jgi:hypothetical protein
MVSMLESRFSSFLYILAMQNSLKEQLELL